MSSVSPSIKLAEIFDSLPPEGQRALVEKHLFPLLDSLSQEKSDHALSVATEFQTRLRSIPKLDLKSKKKQVNILINALSHDAKVAITKERSNREELLAEVVDTLTSWLNDIWSAVYEFRDSYLQAHACLLFIADVSSTLVDMPGLIGCKCSLMNMPIDITIKKQNGKVVKSFALRGPQMIGKAVLWIWRELFVSLSAYSAPSTKKKMPEMIEDIETTMGWEALERLLYGGGASTIKESNGVYGDNDGNDEEIVDIDEEDEDEDYVDEDDEDEACREDDPGGGHCFCSYHASHWPDLINEQRLHLRTLVENRLHANFCVMPSMRLYHVLHAISSDFTTTERMLLQETKENATKSSDTLVGALAIYTATANGQRIAGLLNTHYHLLRTRDGDVLQDAISILATSGLAARGLQILESELVETIRAIHASVTSVFGNVGLETHEQELEGMLKLRAGSQERQDRIHRWVDAIVTLAAPMNPMAFAAMMMGFPLGADMEEEGPEDVAAFLDDVELLDPDWDDLREEFRPQLKERFEGWYHISKSFKDSAVQPLFAKIYHKTVEMMPFLRGADITDHMTLRLTELQGKTHIARGLQALSSFCIIQRKQMNAAANKQRRAAKKAAASAQNATPVLPVTPSMSFPFSFQAQPPSSSPRSPFGGMEDVD